MILALLIAFFSLIALMIIHEFGHFIIAKKFGIKVEEFGIGYPPRIFGKQFGQTFYSVNLIPLGAFVKIYGEEGDVHDPKSFSQLAVWKRILIVLGGVIAFWIAAIIIFSVLFAVGAKVPVSDQDIDGSTDVVVSVVSVEQDSPASLAGLKAGDLLLEVKSTGDQNSKPQVAKIHKISDFQDFIKAHESEQLTLSFERNGQMQEVSLTPRLNPPAGQGPVGVALERLATLIKKYPWYQAPWEGTVLTGKVTLEAFKKLGEFFGSLLGGKGLPSGTQLAGPVGITIFLANSTSYGLGFFLYFIGSLSVLLAIFNLFPIPALDGGKLIFLIIEQIMGRPVPVKWEQTITVIFFLLLIAMSLFITIQFDIPRVVEFWKASL